MEDMFIKGYEVVANKSWQGILELRHECVELKKKGPFENTEMLLHLMQ